MIQPDALRTLDTLIATGKAQLEGRSPIPREEARRTLRAGVESGNIESSLVAAVSLMPSLRRKGIARVLIPVYAKRAWDLDIALQAAKTGGGEFNTLQTQASEIHDTLGCLREAAVLLIPARRVVTMDSR